MSYSSSERISPPYTAFAQQQRPNRGQWIDHSPSGFQDPSLSSPWQPPASFAHASSHSPISPQAGFSSRPGYSNWAGSRPAQLLRRTSSEDASLRHLGQAYYGVDISSSLPNLPPTSQSQRRPSNRDEFDGPSQFLEKPDDGGYEPREDELPELPVSLHAQEQDDILSQVNDRLSQCAFDFVAKYQFPIPVESDKRPVRVPNDREWSEWVYLLKRLATKRRIPARVLYNGQIKQLITILENSLEMRHAAKHQSRPLKDDRNVLQLISSGLQVAKILKDAPAMHFLDSLYAQTERKIQGRRGVPSSLFGTLCIM